MFTNFIFPSFVPITTMSFCDVEATMEQIKVSFCIFLSKNKVYTFPALFLDICQIVNALSRPHVITFVPFLFIIAPVTGVWFAGKL